MTNKSVWSNIAVFNYQFSINMSDESELALAIHTVINWFVQILITAQVPSLSLLFNSYLFISLSNS
jgi:hypothetical protein